MRCPALSVWGPPTWLWTLPKDRAGPRAGPGSPQGTLPWGWGSSLFLSFPSLLTPREPFRTAVLNPQSTRTHSVLMQDTRPWAHPNYEETTPKNVHIQNEKFYTDCQSKSRITDTTEA